MSALRLPRQHNSSSRLIGQSDFYQMMPLSLGASAKNKSAAETQTDTSNKSRSTFKRGRCLLRIPGYPFPVTARALGPENMQFQNLRGRRGHRRIILEQNCGGQQLQLLRNLIAPANHITERAPGAKVLRCYLFIRSLLRRQRRESAEA